jgi:GT2 family glycosyltransferase
LAARLLGDRNEDKGPESRLPKEIAVSIVIATYDRPDDLRKCLAALQSQATRRKVEVVVVDNHPASGMTPPIVKEFEGVKLVTEAKKGLSYARNAGIVASHGELVICTDDDTIAPPGWIDLLLRPFAQETIMAVTGNVLPLEQETEAQVLFEMYGGLGRGIARWFVNGDWFRSFRGAVPTWKLGGTANAAFRRSLFTHPSIGLFDEKLGAGMPTGCSEDTYMFYKILKANFTIAYDPDAYVWHRHRRDRAALRNQLYNYSKGHIAYHLLTFLQDGDFRALVRLGIQLPRIYAARMRASITGRSAYPVSLIVLEMFGNLMGPWALVQSWCRVRRENRTSFRSNTPSGYEYEALHLRRPGDSSPRHHEP